MTGHKFIGIRRAALCLLLSTTAHANEAVTVGAGNVSCGTFLAAMNAMSPAPSGEVRPLLTRQNMVRGRHSVHAMDLGIR